MASKKKMTVKKENLVKIEPVTDAQKTTFKSYDSGQSLFLYGAAGTGKTFISLYKALEESLSDKKTVFIVRSAVPTRDIGFMPGNVEEKTELYQAPYRGMVGYMFEQNNSDDFDSLYNRLVDQGTIKFITTSYIRGITIDNAVIIVDESQNLSFWELNSIITRVGENCKIIFSGDIDQSDLSYREAEGFTKFLSIITDMKEFDIVEFGLNDIVRSGFVKSYLIAKLNSGH